MTTSVRSLRLIAFDSNRLNTLSSERGEIFFDQTNGTLRFFDTRTGDGQLIATRAWVTSNPIGIPSQTGNSGKLLTTNGSTISWVTPTVYSLPTASTSVLGGVKVDGSTITISGGVISGANTYSLPTATTSVLGGVKVDGSTITISGGVISGAETLSTITARGYTTNTAVSFLGGATIGYADGLTILGQSGTSVILKALSAAGSGTTITFPATAGTVALTSQIPTNNNQLTNGAGYITTNGVPTQTGNTGKYLTTNGSTLSWGTVTAYSLPTSSNSVLGGVKVDASSITIDGGGVISVPAVATIGVTNGIAQLGSDGKLVASQIPTSLSGAIVFKGTWNATTNTPTLADGVGTNGWEYAVATGGTRNLGSGNITFLAGDYVIYNGTIWQRIPSNTVAEAGTLTGTTLNATVVTSSLTTVGTLANLTVTNTIAGSVTGNAGTVTNGVVTTGSYADPSWITSLAASKVGLANVTNESKATMFASPAFTGTVTSSGNVGIGNVVSANILGNLHISTDSAASVYFDRYGGAPPNMIYRRANGTLASPTAVQTDNQLFALGGRGYGATGFSTGGRAAVYAAAAENWSDTAQGAYFAITTTPNTTVTARTVVKIDQDGKVYSYYGLTLGASGTAGSLVFTGSTSGTVSLQAGATPDVQTYTLPAAYPSASGYVLASTTGGVLSWTTITATNVGLGNVTNESKATMFASPTFTGTVSGVTKAHVGLGSVENTALSTWAGSTNITTLGTITSGSAAASFVGLGNVTNESKATMFTSPTFTTSADGSATFTAFGSSTALTIGYTGISATNTTNIATAMTGVGYSKTVNIGTGASGAPTTINIGSVSNSTTLINGHVVLETVTSSGATGNGNIVFASSPTISNPTFTGTVSGVTATHVGLGNVTNESKATMFTNPTFTGTVTGISLTATDVGLGNVTNESKSTMFASPTFTGTVSGISASMVSSLKYAKTELVVTNVANAGYRINYPDYSSSNNPIVYATAGETLAFNLNGISGNHPFLIQVNTAGTWANYDLGLVHVGNVPSVGTVNTGTNAQGKSVGMLYWTLPPDIAPGDYRYICSLHFNMTGTIRVKGADQNITSIRSTATGNVDFGGSWGNVNATYYKWDLPAAGTYLVWGTFRARVWGATGYAKIRLYNQTAGTVVTDSDNMLLENQQVGQLNVMCTANWRYVATGATTLYLQGISTTSGASGAGIQADANGWNECGFIRIT